jgi:hypothetical protein
MGIHLTALLGQFEAACTAADALAAAAIAHFAQHPDDTLITSQAHEVFWEDRGVRFPLDTPDITPAARPGWCRVRDVSRQQGDLSSTAASSANAQTDRGPCCSLVSRTANEMADRLSPGISAPRGPIRLATSKTHLMKEQGCPNCSAESTGLKGMCATRRLKSDGGERPSSPGRRSGWVKLGAA